MCSVHDDYTRKITCKLQWKVHIVEHIKKYLQIKIF